MKTRVAAIVLTLCPLFCLGQAPPHYPECIQTAKTQYDLNVCSYEGTKHADDEINHIYAKLIAKLASDPAAVAKIRAMERAWIVYRDAYIEATYPASNKQAMYGSMYPMEVAELRSDLTRKQIDALKQLLHAHDDPGSK